MSRFFVFLGFFSVRISHGMYVFQKLLVAYVKFIFNWAFCIFSGNRSPKAKVKTQKNTKGPLGGVALLPGSG